jgi:hypothetical protein
MPNLIFNGYKGASIGVLTSGTPVARVDFLSDTLKVMLVTSAYTASAADRFVSSAAGAEISVSGYVGGFGGAGRLALASRTLTVDDAGNRALANAAGLTWTALGSGATIAAAILFKELTSDALSPMVAYFAVTATPTNGGNISIVWSSSPAALISLT